VLYVCCADVDTDYIWLNIGMSTAKQEIVTAKFMLLACNFFSGTTMDFYDKARYSFHCTVKVNVGFLHSAAYAIADQLKKSTLHFNRRKS